MLFGLIEIISGLLLLLGLYIWLKKRNAKSKADNSKTNVENLLELNKAVESKNPKKKLSAE
ncbi:MAG: hypothetical protein WCP03_04685 [Candidatus Saccharibacteria bacterium]